MWFATDYGVSRFDGYKFTNYSTKDGLPDNTIFEVYEDYKGRIWFISRSAKLSYYYNDSIHLYWNNDKFLKYIGDVPNILNKTFSVDEQDNVCLGIYMKGIYKISKIGKISYKFKNRTYNNTVLYIENNKTYIDVIIDTMGYKYKSFHKLTIVTDIEEYTIKLDNKNDHSSSLPYLGIIDERGMKYISVVGHLYIIYDSLHYDKYFFNNDQINTLYLDSINTLWVGTRFGGFYCFKNGDITKEPVHYLKVKAGAGIMCDKEGGYWFTTLYDGVYYIPSMKYKTYTSKEGLAEDEQNILETDGKSVYSATYLSPYFNKISGKKIEKENYFDDPNKSITKLYFDKIENKLFIGTRSFLYQYKDKKLKIFDKIYYMPGHYIPEGNYTSGETNEIVRDKNGEIWYGAVNGIYKVYKDTVFWQFLFLRCYEKKFLILKKKKSRFLTP